MQLEYKHANMQAIKHRYGVMNCRNTTAKTKKCTEAVLAVWKSLVSEKSSPMITEVSDFSISISVP